MLTAFCATIRGGNHVLFRDKTMGTRYIDNRPSDLDQVVHVNASVAATTASTAAAAAAAAATATATAAAVVERAVVDVLLPAHLTLARKIYSAVVVAAVVVIAALALRIVAFYARKIYREDLLTRRRGGREHGVQRFQDVRQHVQVDRLSEEGRALGIAHLLHFFLLLLVLVFFYAPLERHEPEILIVSGKKITIAKLLNPLLDRALGRDGGVAPGEAEAHLLLFHRECARRTSPCVADDLPPGRAALLEASRFIRQLLKIAAWSVNLVEHVLNSGTVRTFRGRWYGADGGKVGVELPVTVACGEHAGGEEWGRGGGGGRGTEAANE